jgi:hypothetical protein
MRDRKKDEQAIAAEVQKTLQCLDHLEKARAKPFFYARLHQRMGAIHEREAAPDLRVVYMKFLRPALAPLLIIASIASGILLGYKPATDSRAASLDRMIEAYDLSAPDLSNYTLTAAE